MTRVKRGVLKSKKKKNILSQAKGFRFGRSTKVAQAKEALAHAGAYAFDHRKDKKGVARRLWTTRLNAAVRSHDMPYSKFIDLLKKKNIGLDRKVLSDMAQNNPETFDRIVKSL